MQQIRSNSCINSELCLFPPDEENKCQYAVITSCSSTHTELGKTIDATRTDFISVDKEVLVNSPRAQRHPCSRERH